MVSYSCACAPPDDEEVGCLVRYCLRAMELLQTEELAAKPMGGTGYQVLYGLPTAALCCQQCPTAMAVAFPCVYG